MIVIGVDPHKSTHTAAGVDPVTHADVGSLRIEATRAEYRRLLPWAKQWPHRQWAVENTEGLGHHLAQWLLARGEVVLDMPSTATALVRELSRGARRKNDRIDAAGAACVAAAQGDARAVVPEDYVDALALLDERRMNLTQHRTRTINQLHRLLRELVAGGVPTDLTAAKAAAALHTFRPRSTPERVQLQLCRELIADVRRLDQQLADNQAEATRLLDEHELIRGLDDGSTEGELKSRAAALVFLISQLPHDGVGDTGVRATAPVLADLLVEDLASDGAKLRKDVPRMMEELVEQGRVMKLGDEFRLQTAEGAEWTQEFNQRRASIRTDAARMSSLRNDWLQRAVDTELAGLKFVHGKSKTPRKLTRHWGDDTPATDGSTVPVWIRDEWGVTEAKVREAAAAAGNDSPTVFVLLPKIDAEAIADTLASYAAATDTVSQRPEPQTDEGRQAKQGMQSRVLEGHQRLESLFAAVIAKARVFQGGGNELTTSSLRDGVEAAGNHALARLFPKFPAADDPAWSKVITKARDGAPDALAVVGWQGEVPANPVCKEVLARTSGSGTKGSDLQRDLGDAPFGWPKDTIDGALLALLASGNIRAERDGHPVDGPKELPATQVSKATFFKEDEPPTKQEQLAVRGVLTEAKVPYTSGKEGAAISGLVQHLLDLASRAGGPPPLPEPPDTSYLDGIAALAGNQQVRAVAQHAEQLRQNIKTWSAAGAQRADREAAWRTLERLLVHAATLDLAASIKAQRNEIEADRLLMHLPRSSTSPNAGAPWTAAIASSRTAALTRASCGCRRPASAGCWLSTACPCPHRRRARDQKSARGRTGWCGNRTGSGYGMQHISPAPAGSAWRSWTWCPASGSTPSSRSRRPPPKSRCYSSTRSSSRACSSCSPTSGSTWTPTTPAARSWPCRTTGRR